ncbi:hypothetical protein GCM10010317_095960 [Streptomyces mirabilis]|nr:hypothetical protein GCM10010317_095960 [Streptomyces mirabilis]
MRSRLAAGAAGAVWLLATAALLDDVIGIIRRAAHVRRNPGCGLLRGIPGCGSLTGIPGCGSLRGMR